MAPDRSSGIHIINQLIIFSKDFTLPAMQSSLMNMDVILFFFEGHHETNNCFKFKILN